MYKRLFIVISCIAFFLFVACNRNEKGLESNNVEDKNVIQGDFSGKVLAYSAYTLKGPYYSTLYDTIKKTAEESGFEFIGIDAEDDFQKQINDVDDLLVRGIDVLVLNPFDPIALVPATRRATKEGIPVIVVDSIIDDSADIISMVLADNPNNGQALGKLLADEMKGSPIQMAMISGRQGNPVGKARRMGFMSGLSEAQLKNNNKADYQIVTQLWGEWDEEGGVNAMQDILVAHPAVNVVFAENDPMGLGAIRVLEQADRLSDVLVIAYDGNKQAYEAIKSGKLFATALNDPFLMGEKVVNIGKEYLEGRRNFPRVNPIQSAAISSKNVDEFYNPNSVF